MTLPDLPITNPFGVPDKNAKFGFHAGIDYGCAEGTPLQAPVSGYLRSGYNGVHGLYIDITHKGLFFRIMHLSQVLKQGVVKEGEIVCKSGNTGLSTGPHAHIDIRREEEPTSFASFINPFEYEEIDMATDQSIDWTILMGLKRVPHQEEYERYRPQDTNKLIEDIYKSEERQIMLAKEEAERKKLTEEIADLTKKLELAQAVNGDAGKWQTFKALIRELITIK